MSRRSQKLKADIANIFKITCGLILSLASIFWMTLQTRKNMRIEYATRSPDTLFKGQTSAKSEEAIFLCSILQKIENNFADEFMEDIETLSQRSSLSPDVKNYMLNFKTYCEQHTTKKKPNTSAVEAVYFVRGVFPLIDFLKQNGLNDGETLSYSEVIPYYCIKYFEQGNKKNQTSKNPMNLNLYETYIKTFASMNKKLSEKGADIICLYAKASFDCLKKKSDKIGLRQIQDSIKKYQSEFMNEIGNDGIYERQKNYLSSSLVILGNAINKTRWEKKKLDEYKIPITK